MSYPTDRLPLFDKDGEPLKEISPDEVFSRVRYEKINDEHTLTLSTSRRLEIGWRALTVDGTGRWREWVVEDKDEVHDSGESAIGTYRLVWSLQYDLTHTYDDSGDLGHAEVGMERGDQGYASDAVRAAIAGASRWSVGTCDVDPVGQGNGVVMIAESAWDRLGKVVEKWGGEVDAEIEVDTTGVVSRKVALLKHIGESQAVRRFEWGDDLAKISRHPDPGPYYCRVVPIGKGQTEYAEDDETTFEWPLDITEETGGVEYIQDDEAALAFRTPDGKGGWDYPTKVVKYDESDPELLLAAALDDLPNHTRPRVSYEADVVQLVMAGMDKKGISLGDDVQCVDRGFNPDVGLTIESRAVALSVDEMDETVTATIGEAQETLADRLNGMMSAAERAESEISFMSTTEYVSELIARLNEEINAVGGYAYIVPGEGLITYDIAVDDPVHGYDSRTDTWATMAVQVKGGAIRIANTRTSSGDWEWKSVFTSGHVASYLVTAAEIITGFIGSPGGNYWNLDTGELYFDHGIITNADGTSYWNLTTGEVRLSSSTAIAGSTAGEIVGDIGTLRSDLESTAEELSSSLELTASGLSADISAVSNTVSENKSEIASLKLAAQQFSVDLSSTNSAISTTNANLATTNANLAATNGVVTSMQATYGTCTTAGGTAAKSVTCSNFVLRTGAVVTVKFNNKNTAANPTLNVNSTGAKPITLNGSAIPSSAYWGAGETVSFIYDGSNWAVTDGAANAHIITNSTEIASLKLTTQQFSVDLSNTNSVIATTSSNLAATNAVITSMQATYGTCSTAGGTAAKLVTCSNFSLRTGAAVTVRFSYANTSASPTLNVNSTGAKPIQLNGEALPQSAWWSAGQTMTFVYNGSAWTVADGSTAAQVVSNKSEIASLKLTAQQFSVDLSSHSETLTQLKATYATCTTAGGTPDKLASCSGFSLRAGAIVSVKFSYANTVANPTLNVNSTGAKPIYLNGSALPEDNWWKAGDVVTFVYSGSYWYVSDGSTLTQLAATNSSVSNLTLRADAFDVSIKGVQATYGTCSTIGATQEKVVTIASFTKYVGQTVTVRFSYANTSASPKLKVQNSDSSQVASGTILVNGNVMSSYQYWAAGAVVTFVWDGTYWRVGDGSTASKIEALKDSITLSVTGSLGGTASIKLSVNGTEQSKDLNLTNVRKAFQDDTTTITISAGRITFNSNTFVVNSTYFGVTYDGKITATKGTIGGFTIDTYSIHNNAMTLYSEGLKLKRDGYEVGRIGTTNMKGYTYQRGLAFDLEYRGNYMTWAYLENSSDTAYSMILTYPARSTNGFTTGRLTVSCDLDLQKHKAYNFWIDPNTGGANGGKSGTLNFVKINSMYVSGHNTDGTPKYDGTAQSWNSGSYLTFKNGLLIDAHNLF